MTTHATGRCPFPHGTTQRKTASDETPDALAIEQDGEVWHLRTYTAVRQVLRDADGTRQSILNNESPFPTGMRQPVIFQDGPPHKQQRTAIARFFTPKTVSDAYATLMESLSDQLVDELAQKKSADLSALSMRLATQVAAQIVGLTNSWGPGMDRRIDAMLAARPEPASRLGRTLVTLEDRARLVQFYLRDVRPAIIARRRTPREDVISHLLTMGYNDLEILIECATYASAGMVTTREFICIAAWHLLENEPVRDDYLKAQEKERHRILHEILRLEPVASHLYRRTVTDMQLEHAGKTYHIPAGALLNLDIRAANADAAAVGAEPLNLCPHRELAQGAQPQAMSFGDGAHRCPGAFVAIQESDVFLQRLLRLPLRLEGTPRLDWNARLESYEVRDFKLTVEPMDDPRAHKRGEGQAAEGSSANAS